MARTRQVPTVAPKPESHMGIIMYETIDNNALVTICLHQRMREEDEVVERKQRDVRKINGRRPDKNIKLVPEPL